MPRDKISRCDHVPEIPRFLALAILRIDIQDWFGGAGRCAGLSLMILGCWRGLVPRSEIFDVSRIFVMGRRFGRFVWG